MQNENFVAYYKSIVGSNESNAKLPPGLPLPPHHRMASKSGAGQEAENKKSHRKSSHKRRKTQEDDATMDESFFNSVNHQLINELVGEQHPASTNTSLIGLRVAEDVKHVESGANTTNHSTGDSQNSSSAEKVERRCCALNEVDVEEASSSSSSGNEDRERGFCVPNESLKSFITDSPFSFKNPIFFSVPRDQ
jgi:hypothetical protein